MTKQVSTFTVDKDDPYPDAQLVRLCEKWRRERGLDDSYEHMHASSQAVLKANPQLAKAYFAQPNDFQKFGAAHFTKAGDDE